MVHHWAYHDALVNLADHLPDSLTLFLVELVLHDIREQRPFPVSFFPFLSRPAHNIVARL